MTGVMLEILASLGGGVEEGNVSMGSVGEVFVFLRNLDLDETNCSCDISITGRPCNVLVLLIISKKSSGYSIPSESILPISRCVLM